jgi:hypothetical protein
MNMGQPPGCSPQFTEDRTITDEFQIPNSKFKFQIPNSFFGLQSDLLHCSSCSLFSWIINDLPLLAGSAAPVLPFRHLVGILLGWNCLTATVENAR